MLLTILFALALTLTPSEALQKASGLYEENRYKEAVETLCEELPSIRKAQDPSLLGETLSLLASSYFRLGIFDKAIAAQKECYDIDLASKDSSAISSSLNNLAAMYMTTEDFKMAEKLIREAIGYEEPLGHSDALAVRYGMAADILVNRKKPEEAESFARKALALDEEAGREGNAAKRKSQLAQALLEQGKLTEASELLVEAYPVFDREKNRNSQAICRFQQGIIAVKEGFENLAANYLREARELSITIGNKYLQKKVTKELSSLLRTSDPSEASKYMQEYAALTDSIFHEKTAEELNDFKIKQEVEQRDRDLAVKEIEVRDLRTIRTLLMIIAGLLALALVLVIWIATIRQKNIRMLRQTLEIKDRILEIHEGQSSCEEKHEKMTGVIEDLSRIVSNGNETLTRREQQIADLCCEGLISKEIADRLGLSTRTVETHKNNIFRKLGIHTTEELIQRMKKQ